MFTIVIYTYVTVQKQSKLSIFVYTENKTEIEQ